MRTRASARDAVRRGAALALIVTVAASSTACERGEKQAPKVLADDEPHAPSPTRGVHPEDFQCESVAPLPDWLRGSGAHPLSLVSARVPVKLLPPHFATTVRDLQRRRLPVR